MQQENTAEIEEGDTEPLAMAFGYVNFNYQNNNLELKEKNRLFLSWMAKKCVILKRFLIAVLISCQKCHKSGAD